MKRGVRSLGTSFVGKLLKSAVVSLGLAVVAEFTTAGYFQLNIRMWGWLGDGE